MKVISSGLCPITWCGFLPNPTVSKQKEPGVIQETRLTIPKGQGPLRNVQLYYGSLKRESLMSERCLLKNNDNHRFQQTSVGHSSRFIFTKRRLDSCILYSDKYKFRSSLETQSFPGFYQCENGSESIWLTINLVDDHERISSFMIYNGNNYWAEEGARFNTHDMGSGTHGDIDQRWKYILTDVPVL